MYLLRPILGAAAAALLVPQAAQAAALAGLAPCYRSVDEDRRETVPVRGSGFTPGVTVTVRIDGAVVAEGVTVQTDGTVEGSVLAPYQPRGERPFMLTVTEDAQRANTAGAASRVTALGMRLKPRRANPSRKVRFIGRGFTDTDERIVYAHYVRGGKLRRTVKLGVAQGLCGRIRVKRRQFPIRNPRVGRWTLQVDNQPTYSAEPLSVHVRIPIDVKRDYARRP